MSVKMVAIGILTLLALSLVMSSRAVRMIFGVGALGLLVLVATWGFSSAEKPAGHVGDVGERSNVNSWMADLDWQSLIRRGRDLQKMADTTSQKIWKGLTTSTGGTDAVDLVGEYAPVAGGADSDDQTTPKAANRVVLHRIPIKIDDPLELDDDSTPEMGQVRLLNKMKIVIGKYLEEYQKLHPRDIGVAQLKPENLDWSLIKWRPGVDPDNPGRARITLVFDDRLHQHVRDQGRKSVTARRLKSTTSASFAVLGVISVLFGVLKFVTAWRKEVPENDLLLASEIKMM